MYELTVADDIVERLRLSFRRRFISREFADRSRNPPIFASCLLSTPFSHYSASVRVATTCTFILMSTRAHESTREHRGASRSTEVQCSIAVAVPYLPILYPLSFFLLPSSAIPCSRSRSRSSVRLQESRRRETKEKE